MLFTTIKLTRNLSLILAFALVPILAGCTAGPDPLPPASVARIKALDPRLKAGDPVACLEAGHLYNALAYGREGQVINTFVSGDHFGTGDNSPAALECMHEAADALSSAASQVDVPPVYFQQAAERYAYLNRVGYYTHQGDASYKSLPDPNGSRVDSNYNQDMESLQHSIDIRNQNQPARDQYRAAMGGILASGASNLANIASQGQANLAAAKSGQITGPLQPDGTNATILSSKPTVIPPKTAGGGMPDLTIHLPPGAGMRETYLEAARLERVAAAAEKNPAQRAADLQAAQQNEAAAAALNSNAPTAGH